LPEKEPAVQHNIPLTETNQPMADAIESCVHCGFCLPTCPTYVVMGNEMNSPRGRIVLMKEVLEGTLSLDEATPFIDPCLGCLACVSACPSGVAYGELITPFRMKSEGERHRPMTERLLRRLILETLPYPWRFRLATRAGQLAQFVPDSVLRRLPGQLTDMLRLLPERVPVSESLPELYPATGKRRARVTLLAGCAQQVLAPDINWATLRVLARQGVEVAIPKAQSCCGALAAHTGVKEQAQRFAKHNLTVFPEDVDAIISNAAGCGSGMHEYPLWLTGEPEAAQAEAFSHKVRDISVFLHELGFRDPPQLKSPMRVAYHDACHLAHAQQITQEPRALLQQVKGLTLVELAESELCCGSAGTYNLEHPETARELGARKAAHIQASGADMVVTGNIGCLTQLTNHLKMTGQDIPVLHTVQLLDRAYRNNL
jgi:glycolate oxidase iron-sulfur subunit